MTGRVSPRRTIEKEVIVVGNDGTDRGKIEQSFDSEELEVEGASQLGWLGHDGRYADLTILLGQLRKFFETVV